MNRVPMNRYSRKVSGATVDDAVVNGPFDKGKEVTDER